MASEDSAPTDRPIRLVIADGDRRVRESLAALVGSDERVDVVGRAGLPTTAIELMETEQADLVIVDPRFPDVDAGLVLIAAIKRRWPQTRILAMSWAPELESACRAAGVDGFVSKADAPSVLVEAIVAAGRGAANELAARLVTRRVDATDLGDARAS